MTIDDLVQQKLPTDSELKRVEIFVLHHSIVEPTKRCLWKLIKNTSWPYKINLFNTHMYPKGVMAKIYNKLIEESTCDYIAFVCSDSEVGNGWLDESMKLFRDDIACIAPLITPPVNSAIDFNPNSGMHQVSAEEMSISVSIFRKEAIIKVGGFNEKFYLYGHDVDLLRKIENSGYKLYVNSNVTAEHQIGTTTKLIFTKEELEIVDEYNKSVQQEWGDYWAKNNS